MLRQGCGRARLGVAARHGYVAGRSSKVISCLSVAVTPTPDDENPEAALVVLTKLVRDDLELCNRLIVEHMDSPVSLIPQLAAHIVAAGGKRLRPLLTLAAAAYEGVGVGPHARRVVHVVGRALQAHHVQEQTPGQGPVYLLHIACRRLHRQAQPPVQHRRFVGMVCMLQTGRRLVGVWGCSDAWKVSGRWVCPKTLHRKEPNAHVCSLHSLSQEVKALAPA